MTVTNPQFEEAEAAAIAQAVRDAAEQAHEPFPPARQANWALFVFALSLVVNFLDRGILNLLVEPIKRDLHLSDVQVSYLMGFAFVIFYVIMGLPIARLVDSKSRRVIMGFGLGCWSLMTAACGLAQNFLSFFVARVGVGVGEACTGPATYSMLADLFPRAKLPRAIAFLNMGTIVGSGLAMVIGAGVIQALSGAPDLHVPLIGTVHNWQMVFFIVGAPGMVVALLMMTVPEPARRGLMTRPATETGPRKAIPVSAVAKFVGVNWKTYVPMWVSMGFGVLNLFGAQAWGPTFYQRSYGWAPQKTALILGVASMIIVPVSLMAGSRLAEWYDKRGLDDANLRVCRWTMLLSLPFTVLSPLMPTPWLALGLSLVGLAIAGASGGPQNAAFQTITPNEMRGQMTALYLFIFNVVGSGMGPTFIALLTEGVFHDEAKLRFALALSAATVGSVGALFMWVAVKPYGQSVARAKTWA